MLVQKTQSPIYGSNYDCIYGSIKSKAIPTHIHAAMRAIKPRPSPVVPGLIEIINADRDSNEDSRKHATELAGHPCHPCFTLDHPWITPGSPLVTPVTELAMNLPDGLLAV